MKRFLKIVLIIVLILANCCAGWFLYRQYVISPKTDSVKWKYSLLNGVAELKDNKIKNIKFDADGNLEEIILKKNIEFSKGDKLYISYEGECFICSVSEYDNDSKTVYTGDAEIEEVFDSFSFKVKRSPLSAITSNNMMRYSKHNDIKFAVENNIGSSGMLFAYMGIPHVLNAEPVLLAPSATDIAYDDAKDLVDTVTKGGVLGTGFRIDYDPDTKRAYFISKSIFGQESEPSYLGDGISNFLSLTNQLGDKVNHSFSLDFDSVQKIKDEVGYESANGYYVESGMSATAIGHIDGEIECSVPILDASLDTGVAKIDNTTSVTADSGHIDVDYEVSIKKGKLQSANIIPRENNYLDPHNFGIENKTSVSIFDQEIASEELNIPVTVDRDIDTDTARNRQNNVKQNLSNMWNYMKDKGKRFVRHLMASFGDGDENNQSSMADDIDDYYSIYEPTLWEYKELLSEFHNGNIEAFYGYTGTGTTIAFNAEINDYGNISYTLYDIDGNGIKELIIGAWDDNNCKFGDILHIYCVEDEEIQFVGIPSKVWYDAQNDSFDNLEVIYSVEISKQGVCFASTLLDEGYRNVSGNRWILDIPLDELSKYQGMTSADIFTAEYISQDDIVSFEDDKVHDLQQFNGMVLE